VFGGNKILYNTIFGLSSAALKSHRSLTKLFISGKKSNLVRRNKSGTAISRWKCQESDLIEMNIFSVERASLKVLKKELQTYL